MQNIFGIQFVFFLVLILFSGCQELPKVTPGRGGGVIMINDYLLYSISPDGRNERFVDRLSGQNYAVTNSPCAQIRRAGKEFPVTAASFKNGLLSLQFAEAKAEAVLQVAVRKGYFALEVKSLTGTETDEFVFTDVPLILHGASNEPFTGTALAMNLQTLVRELPQPMSRLRASCYPRFGFAGARVALIGCPEARLRGVMQQVVSDSPELPKSSLGGPWAWDAPATRGSYLFDFGNLNEQTATDWIKLTQSLGFTQIDFHGGRSFRFGDCQVNPEVFPRGRDGFKTTIDMLHAAGIAAGLHTYAFFIDKKAPWVTPVPDPRLASDVTFTLAEDFSPEGSTIQVLESTAAMSAITGFFVRNSVTLRIENELVTYTGISKSAPFQFTGCKRGAYGTRAAAHSAGTKVQHLKECFGLFVPDPETTLLAEVAQKTADFYNQCGFDMIYLDALDGEDILGGGENAWHYGSQFVFEIAKRLKKPALMEMSTFHHHLWCVRSRAGAWDHPRRAQKEFIDLHLAANESSHRMFLPANLGWWAVKNWNGAQEEQTFTDDIEYLCGKALGTDSGLSLMGIDPKNAGGMSRFAEIFKRYEKLRQSNQVPESIKNRLRLSGKEYRLVELPGGGWEFRPIRYEMHKVEANGSETDAWMIRNEFGSQGLRLRIEGLMGAGGYDAATNVVLADAESVSAFTNRESAAGVSSELGLDSVTVKAGSTSLFFAATNSSNSSKGAWTKIERIFNPPVNLSGREGLGLWVYGDGQGELLNVQLRCPEHVVAGIGDHYIPIDFTGWRYFELIEPESRRWADYKWPYGDAYSIYRESIIFNQVSSLGLWFNDLPAGKSVKCELSPIKALPLSKSVLRRPRLTVGKQTIVFPVEIESGGYLEMNSGSDCKLYMPKGEPINVNPEGEAPILRSGTNEIKFGCEKLQTRAKVTLLSEGQAIRP
jgi:hypothetical protein